MKTWSLSVNNQRHNWGCRLRDSWCENIHTTMTAADLWASHRGPSLGGDSDWGASGAEGHTQLNAKTFISRIFLLPSETELTAPAHNTFSHILCSSVHTFPFPCSLTRVIWAFPSSYHWALGIYLVSIVLSAVVIIAISIIITLVFICCQLHHVKVNTAPIQVSPSLPTLQDYSDVQR